MTQLKYNLQIQSNPALYGHPLNTDTSLIRTVYFVPGSLRAGSPIWASKASFMRTHGRSRETRQPRPQGFSLNHPFFKGKALGTRLETRSTLPNTRACSQAMSLVKGSPYIFSQFNPVHTPGHFLWPP